MMCDIEDKTLFISYNFRDECLHIYNVIQTWNDERVKHNLKNLHIQLNNNVVLSYNDVVLYGVEDDYQITIYMNINQLTNYLLYIINERLVSER